MKANCNFLQPCPSTDDGLHRLGEVDLSSKVLLFLRPLTPLRQGMLSSVQVSTLPLSITFIHEGMYVWGMTLDRVRCGRRCVVKYSSCYLNMLFSFRSSFISCSASLIIFTQEVTSIRYELSCRVMWLGDHVMSCDAETNKTNQLENSQNHSQQSLPVCAACVTTSSLSSLLSCV